MIKRLFNHYLAIARSSLRKPPYQIEWTAFAHLGPGGRGSQPLRVGVNLGVGGEATFGLAKPLRRDYSVPP